MISNEILYLANSIPKQSIIVLHIGMRGLYNNNNNNNYGYFALKLLDQIRKILEPKEIYVPTFTYSFTKSGIFDVRATPAEVGRFSEEIRKNPELVVKRSLDPVFSVIETERDDPEDKQIITNAFGENSIWARLDNENHYILNINLTSSIISTQLHHFEYNNNIPYRYLKTFEGEIVDQNGENHHINYDYFVRDLSNDIEWNRKKIADLARSHGGLVETSIIRSFDWQILKRALINEISSNPNFLIT